MGSVLIMFMVDIILYSVIIWYVDKIAPGKYGVAEKWYFLFSPGYWLNINKVSASDNTDFDREIVKDISMFEAEPTTKAGIKVLGLRKEFKKVSLCSMGSQQTGPPRCRGLFRGVASSLMP